MATDVDGELIRDRLKNNWQRVLYRLWVCRERAERYWLVPGVETSIVRGWLPIWAVCEAMIGGSSGDRRLRECREHGIPFVHTIVNGHRVPYKIHTWYLYGVEKKTFIYRIDCDLTPDDWEDIIVLNSKYYYSRPDIRKESVKKVALEPVMIEMGSNNQLKFA